jgi:hypothetical protein
MDTYAMDCMTAFATLPALLCDIRNAKEEDDEPQWTTSHLASAREFKAKVSQHSLKFHLDYLNPSIVLKIPLSPGNRTQTVLEFNEPKIAFRYNFYWAITIIANVILLDFGEEDQLLVQEYEDAAENICRSLEYLHSLKPLGALWLMFAASMAYGVTGEENRRKIVRGMHGCYHPIPMELRPFVLEKTFRLLTGGDDV